MSSPYLAYIAAAYGMTFLGVSGLILWVLLDGADLRRRLAALDARGLPRRSDDV